MTPDRKPMVRARPRVTGFSYRIRSGVHRGKLARLVGRVLTEFHAVLELEDGTRVTLHRSQYTNVAHERPGQP